jgi:glycosyltransferase involved in cell wall biosynthesis
VSLGQGAIDPGFGVPVRWDVPLFDGYDSESLPMGERTARRPDLLLSKIREFRPDAIVIMLSYLDPIALEVVAIARLLRIPILWRTDANDVSKNRKPLKHAARAALLRAIYALSDGFLAIGKLNREHYLRHGASPRRIFRTPYNIDDELFERGRARWAPERRQLRASFGLDDDHFLFMFTGKFLRLKDPLAILRAAAIAREPNRVAVALIGTGELFDEAKKLASELLPGRHILPGFVNQSALARYYVMADAAVLPSHADAWGLVVNEAQLFSLPVIASDKTGAVPDLVIEDKTGYVFPAGDVSALADAMSDLMSNPEKAQRLGKNARELALTCSTAESCRGIVSAVRELRGA